MLHWSLRSRLTALTTLFAGVLVAATAVSVLAIQRQQLVDRVDDTLVQLADDHAERIAVAGPSAVRAGDPDDDRRFVQIVDGEGFVLASSANLVGRPAIAVTADTQRISTRSVTVVDDDRFRVLSRPVSLPAGAAAVLHIGESIDDLDDSLASLRFALAAVIPAVVGLLGVLVWLMVGRALQPVERIRSEVGEISETALDRRVPEPPTGDEIARLAATMNAMLDRLEESTLRQRRFIADASHELRSPIARLRTELEVALASPDIAEHRATLERLHKEAVSLQRVVSDLLHLARADAGLVGGRREGVDLDDLVLRETRRLRADGHHVVIDDLSAAHVVGDAGQLGRMVRNLLENAVRHADHSVDVSLDEVDGLARLTVADDGPGIPPDERERVFERFARLDAARSDADGGTGLGLAIVAEIVQAHGGQVRVDAAAGGGARFTVSLPLPER